jgi:hypothetical protein
LGVAAGLAVKTKVLSQKKRMNSQRRKRTTPKEMKAVKALKQPISAKPMCSTAAFAAE